MSHLAASLEKNPCLCVCEVPVCSRTYQIVDGICLPRWSTLVKAVQAVLGDSGYSSLKGAKLGSTRHIASLLLENWLDAFRALGFQF